MNLLNYMISKLGKRLEENYRPISLMNIGAKFSVGIIELNQHILSIDHPSAYLSVLSL